MVAREKRLSAAGRRAPPRPRGGPVARIAGVDTGGTFTDAVVLEGGRVTIDKTLSTPVDPSAAVARVVSALAPNAAPDTLIHGSTVATNALLEQRGARTALVTNAGFEDLLEIGRQNRQDLWSLSPSRPAPLVPRHLRLGIPERTDASGRRVARWSAADLQALIARLERARVEAVAIGLLHSYRNPAAEKELGRALRCLGVPVSLSSDVAREFREFERLSTVVINAYVTPVMDRYLRRLARRLRGSHLFVMQSSGGSAPVREILRRPVHTVLSGPAGGVAGAAGVAARAGCRRLITLDMGGTSTDVALVDGQPAMTHQFLVGGRPLLAPAIDIHTVGAGGGSIAWVDRGGALRVGPRSAGADPGPACYGRGEEATVTDAHLALGRLPPEGLLGGDFPLDAERAAAAITRLARRLGTTPRRTALGILEVADATMARAIRVVSLHRGHDPRDFSLMAFGGAGGLHADRLARALGMQAVIIPPYPGVLSALGLAASPTRKEVSRSILEETGGISEKRLGSALESLEHQARRELGTAAGAGPLEARHLVDCRYLGQSHELTLPCGADLAARFHAAHRERYGHALEGTPVEIVTLRVRLSGPPLALPLTKPPRRSPSRPGGRTCPRFGRTPLPVYRRASLGTSSRITGPALITEKSGTTIIEAASHARVDSVGCLWIER